MQDYLEELLDQNWMAEEQSSDSPLCDSDCDGLSFWDDEDIDELVEI